MPLQTPLRTRTSYGELQQNKAKLKKKLLIFHIVTTIHIATPMNTYELPDITVSVDATPSRLRIALEEMFLLCQTTSRRADLRIKGRGSYQSEFGDIVPDWLLQKTAGLDIGREPTMISGPSNEVATVGISDELLFFAWTDKKAKEIQLACGMKAEGRTIGIIQPVLVPILREALLAKGLLLLHGAAFVCPNGMGLLLIAVSGGGKTTTALSLLRNGAKMVADDLVMIRASDHEVAVFGIPKLLNIRRETFAFFEELESLPESSFARMGPLRKLVSPYTIYGEECMARESRVSVLYFLNLTEHGPSLRPLSASEASQRLILAHAFCCNQRLSAFSVDELLSVLSRVSTYELKTGSDPKRLGEWLLSNIGQHAEG